MRRIIFSAVLVVACAFGACNQKGSSYRSTHTESSQDQPRAGISVEAEAPVSSSQSAAMDTSALSSRSSAVNIDTTVPNITAVQRAKTPSPFSTDSALHVALGKPDSLHEVIRTGELAETVDELDTAERRINKIVSDNGGYIANATRGRSSGNTLTGKIQIKVPSRRFDAVVDAVRKLGTVETENIAANDVTQEAIDLAEKLKAESAQEAKEMIKLRQQIASKHSSGKTRVELEGVRAEIEGVEGQIHQTRRAAAVSDLTVNLYEPGALGPGRADTFGGRLGGSFQVGLDGMLKILGVLTTAFVTVLPLLVIGCALYLLFRVWKKRQPAEVSVEISQQQHTSSRA